MNTLIDEYWENYENTDGIERGMYVVLPLIYSGDFDNINIDSYEKISFESNDFTEDLAEKCKSDQFVKRFQINRTIDSSQYLPKAIIEDIQLFAFSNSVCFLAVYFSYKNSDIKSIYNFFNPGYFSEEKEILEMQKKFIANIYEEVFGDENKFKWYVRQDAIYIIKEAYRLNVAKVDKRFRETSIVNQLTYNQHRMIDITRRFSDESELDIAYTSGARDVEDCLYGWGCCITSQEISYTYKTGMDLLERVQEDLLLTILVMYQRYTCFILNEEIHQRYKENVHTKTMVELKTEALEFIAYGTLAPSQVSRWNNVCETYRHLIEMNGIDEAIEEIQQKITLLNEEQERIDAKRESLIGSIIAVFGLVSIIAALLQTVDYVVNGEPIMVTWFVISLIAIILFSLVLLIIRFRRNKRRGDM